MGIIQQPHRTGVTVVVDGLPAGQRAPVRGWFDLADELSPRPARPATRVVVLAPTAAASTRAWTSRRCSATDGHDALIGANRGCYAAFAAVYDCEVPVIAAVQRLLPRRRHRAGRQRGHRGRLRGRHFGLPEVDRGALGAATHLARLVPQQLMRAMVYTGEARYRDRAARTTARCSRWCRATSCGRRPGAGASEIAAKDPTVIRRAKESLNGIDPSDVVAATASSRASRSS